MKCKHTFLIPTFTFKWSLVPSQDLTQVLPSSYKLFLPLMAFSTLGTREREKPISTHLNFISQNFHPPILDIDNTIMNYRY